MNHKAIYKLYPNVVTIDDSTGSFDKDGNKIEIDLSLVNSWIDPEAYKNLRVKEYHIVDVSEIPTDRTFRNAWTWQ